MLADLDDPPTPRWRGLLVGVLIALPVAALFLYFALPALRSAIVGGSKSFDARLRLEDDYMNRVCSEAMVMERDEDLCTCVLAMEYPSLDCRGPFMAWTLAQQEQQCESARDEAIAFCACVESLQEQLQAPEAAAPGKLRRTIIGRYAGCAELDDALALPPVDALPTP